MSARIRPGDLTPLPGVHTATPLDQLQCSACGKEPSGWDPTTPPTCKDCGRQVSPSEFATFLGPAKRDPRQSLGLTVFIENPNERALRRALHAAGATPDDLRAGVVQGFITTNKDCACQGTGIVTRGFLIGGVYRPAPCSCVVIRIVRALPP